jgi:hypothetical protein
VEAMQTIKSVTVPAVTIPEERKATLLENLNQRKKEGKSAKDAKKPNKKHKKSKKPVNTENKEVDPERWLPKWQRAKFRKLAMKKGMHVTQGDISVSTSKGPSTAGLTVASDKSKKAK